MHAFCRQKFVVKLNLVGRGLSLNFFLMSKSVLLGMRSLSEKEPWYPTKKCLRSGNPTSLRMPAYTPVQRARACSSLVPRPRPAFRRLQYGTVLQATESTVLQVTESWAGPGNEARTSSCPLNWSVGGHP